MKFMKRSRRSQPQGRIEGKAGGGSSRPQRLKRTRVLHILRPTVNVGQEIYSRPGREVGATGRPRADQKSSRRSGPHGCDPVRAETSRLADCGCGRQDGHPRARDGRDSRPTDRRQQEPLTVKCIPPARTRSEMRPPENSRFWSDIDRGWRREMSTAATDVDFLHKNCVVSYTMERSPYRVRYCAHARY